MDLETVRSKLVRLEDTICISIFERMQFKLDRIIYDAGGVHEMGGIPIPDYASFFEYLFRKLEEVYDSVGRYAHPEERPFFIVPTTPVISSIDDIGIKPVTNLTGQILSAYMACLPKLCQEGDDNQRGSPAAADIDCLQALSRRIHLGEQVAEAKYRKDKAAYDVLIRNGDREGIAQRLRDAPIEAKNLARISDKSIRYQLPGEIVCGFFRDAVMPLTIEVEIAYFLAKDNKPR